MRTKECPSCKTSNPLSANFCRKCGNRFPEYTKSDKNDVCHIENFITRNLGDGHFIIEWNVVNAEKVELNGKDVTKYNKIIITVKGEQKIILRAENHISCDIKEKIIVHETQTIYKNKIIEKKVQSKTNVQTIFLLAIFFILSLLLTFYAYDLEDSNYKGELYISRLIGGKPYLTVNDATDSMNVLMKPYGDSIMFNVNTNMSNFDVLDIPDWCTLNKQDSKFYIKAGKNSSNDREARIMVRTQNDSVTVKLKQKLYNPQRLLIDGKETVYTYLNSKEGKVTYKIDTDADNYSIKDLSSWFKVLNKDKKSFTISYEANTQDTERQDYFKVNTDNKEIIIFLTQAEKISGNIDSFYIDHNVYEGDKKGMKIHLKFNINGMRGLTGLCVAYFYYEDGEHVKAKNESYCTIDGNSCCYKNFIPPYKKSSFNDFVMFMPYDEIEVSEGEHSMKIYCKIWDSQSKDAESITNSQFHYFTFRKLKTYL